MKRIFILFYILCVVIFFSGCSVKETVDQNEKPAFTLVDNDSLPVFIIPQPDSVFISNLIESKQIDQKLLPEILAFYSARNFRCAWFNEHGLTEQSGKVVNMVSDYFASGVVDTSFLFPGIGSLYDQVSDESFTPLNNDTLVMEADIMFTAQFLSFSKLAWKGINEDRLKKLNWFLPVNKFSEVDLLTDALAPDKNFIKDSVPVFRQYFLLKEKLKLFSEIQKAGGWDSLTYPLADLHPGDSSSIIKPLKARIKLTGGFNISIDDNLLDSAFAATISDVRKSFGLTPEAVIDKKLINELNVSVETRIHQMLLNMERWKWVPADPGKNFIAVNIPEFILHVFENDVSIKSMKVIVGKNANQTVIFSGDLKYVVLSPYWVIPRSIIINETVPAIKKNQNYLTKHNMEIFTGSPAKVIPASQIDWNKYSGSTFPYSIRQKPGPSNSLGYAKFLFPNEYSIYLHDTPARDLFSREGRTFSHGCIRIAEPKWLATYLLRSDTLWNEKKIEAAMHSGSEKYVTLKETIPVYITYFTSWVDAKGILNFRKDVYGHDRKLEKELFGQR